MGSFHNWENVSGLNSLTKRRFNWRIIGPFFAAIAVMMTLKVWNKYLFQESNVFIWVLFLVVAAILVTKGRLPKHFYFPSVSFFFLVLILYAWVRLDDPLNIDLRTRIFGVVSSGFTHVVYLVMYYVLFICSALIYENKGKFSAFFWFLTCGYILANIYKFSIDISGLQEGFNLIPGFVLIPLLPFLFFVPVPDAKKLRGISILLSIFCLILLTLIGSRTGVITILLFLGTLHFWPWITKTKKRFNGFFVAICAVVFAIYPLIIILGNIYSTYSFMGDSQFHVFNKALGTGREALWLELFELILRKPVWGYGTDDSTLLLKSLFSITRRNLSSHSILIEILFRLGIVGLFSFGLIFVMIWRLYWLGRAQWVVRVAGSFLISIMFFSSMGTYLFFTEMSLRSGFAWIALGIGAGACLRISRELEEKRFQQEVESLASSSYPVPPMNTPRP